MLRGAQGKFLSQDKGGKDRLAKPVAGRRQRAEFGLAVRSHQPCRSDLSEPAWRSMTPIGRNATADSRPLLRPRPANHTLLLFSTSPHELRSFNTPDPPARLDGAHSPV